MSAIGTDGHSMEQLISRNRYGVRSLQAKYLQNEYDKLSATKNAEKMPEKEQKGLELQMLDQLNSNYVNQISDHRQKKLREMKSLSGEYEDFIRNREQKGRNDKHVEKHLEQSTLQAPTWIRDVFTERETYRKNMDHYSNALNDHVRLQAVRKEAEREEEQSRKRRIEQEDSVIARKEKAGIEARHRQKSLFEQRQNDLLGVRSQYNEGIGAGSSIPAETVLRRREQDLYSQGLELQLRNEHEKRVISGKERTASVGMSTQVYNPITNPIPFVYKNPNVLRMLAHN